MSSPRMFAILGPTASGKSALAVAVAERLGAEIVGVDAFQIYRGLDRLGAKPEPDLLRRVPHHLVGEVPLSESLHVARFREMALERIEAIHSRGNLPLLVGGNGLYYRSLVRPLAELPPGEPALRRQLEQEPTERLLERLAELDPDSLRWIDRQNRRRLVRAVEVCLLTGRPFSETRTGWEPRPASVEGVLLAWGREDLRERIRVRTERMFEAGVLEEVRTAGDRIGPTAAQMLGLREIRAVLEGNLSETAARESITVATRQYAKRQMTWFRREPGLVPVPMAGAKAIEEAVEVILKIVREGRQAVGQEEKG